MDKTGFQLLERRKTRLPSPGWETTQLHSIPDFSQIGERPATSESVISQMISQDIHLCTTIDWLAADEDLSFPYFLQEVNLPMITSCDSANWVRMKRHAIKLSSRHKPITMAISALQLLFKAQHNSLPAMTAISRYEIAKNMLEATLGNNAIEFETLLVNIFINTLFSLVIFGGEDCILRQSTGPYMAQLKSCVLNSDQKTIITSRISSWLQIMHAAARRGGNRGIMSDEAMILLSDKTDTSILPLRPQETFVPLGTQEYDGELVFQFYCQLQRLSLRIANLSHYHRSRSTGTDQEEVSQLMSIIKAELLSLWTSRPALMQCELGEIRAQILSTANGTLVEAVTVSIAAYHTELLEVARTLNEPQPAIPEAQRAMHQIRCLVEGERNSFPKQTLNPGFLRPLFMYAIEATRPEDTRWAVARMREIRDPISHSDFFASYAEKLTEQQSMKGRRCTTRWFCYQEYGVAPPVL